MAKNQNNSDGSPSRRTPIQEQFQKPVTGSIPTIIRTFKAAVTRRIGREHNATGIRQRNYYEHVIRNHTVWDRIHWYIESNPLLWAEDNENLTNIKLYS